MEKIGIANLRISFLGGGYDFPKFFNREPVTILAEGINLFVTCYLKNDNIYWEIPTTRKGLSSSSARTIALHRLCNPEWTDRQIIEHTIQIEKDYGGGWQDPIACAQLGLIKIRLEDNNWIIEPIENIDEEFYEVRQLYEIDYTHNLPILKELQQSTKDQKIMDKWVQIGIQNLKENDFKKFGEAILETWEIKKRWHPSIINKEIEQMILQAEKAGAYGYKVCGAGGQGYLLVIGNSECHQKLRAEYKSLIIPSIQK